MMVTLQREFPVVPWNALYAGIMTKLSSMSYVHLY